MTAEELDAQLDSYKGAAAAADDAPPPWRRERIRERPSSSLTIPHRTRLPRAAEKRTNQKRNHLNESPSCSSRKPGGITRRRRLLLLYTTYEFFILPRVSLSLSPGLFSPPRAAFAPPSLILIALVAQIHLVAYPRGLLGEHEEYPDPERHDVQARQAQKDDIERVQPTLFIVRQIPQPTHVVPARNN